MRKVVKNKKKGTEEEMGRKKIELKPIECIKERSSKYSKRKKGIFKKAEEISKLCDIDIALLTFSPTSKATLFTPHSRSSCPFSILSNFFRLKNIIYLNAI